ncbi:major facilitator superfamily domain-containing protein [Dactylonectria estremocensis]|uniref:Major facilitator superfamily domain-containing protein n=1 Tax=Dactylonectria estremocensis TaxID=1079267 RepID=A0A9P9DC44_9HYPO|nr:major facilitator superfamily domain-containing protein [Dactylonectria estremocensis]
MLQAAESNHMLTSDLAPDEPAVVHWDGPHDPENPYNWSLRKKWFAVSIGLFATFISLMNGTIITTAHEAIGKEFHVSDENFPHSYWPVASWGTGGALFSLVLLPLMEDFGMRMVFLIVYTVFICFLIPIGLAPNFATLIVTRFFSGGCVAILGNSVAGIISNVFDTDRARTIPNGLYIVVYLTSSSIGPVIGAVILQFLSWQWIGYIELIWTAVFFPIFILALPETRGSAILTTRAKRLRKQGHSLYSQKELESQSMRRAVLESVRRPLYMLCTESVVFISTIWTSFSLGVIYLFTQSVEQVYADLYGWDAVQAGYIQAAIVIGEILGFGLCLLTNEWYYASASRNKEAPGTPIPEARLYAAVLGGFIGVTGGMFVYAWASYSSIHWTVPAVGLMLVGLGTTAVIVSIANYLIDAYSNYAGSAIGATVLGENLGVSFLPLASSAMYTNLGFHWASSLLGFISLVLAAAPIAVFIWGKEIRARSPFMKSAMTKPMEFTMTQTE